MNLKVLFIVLITSNCSAQGWRKNWHADNHLWSCRMSSTECRVPPSEEPLLSCRVIWHPSLAYCRGWISKPAISRLRSFSGASIGGVVGPELLWRERLAYAKNSIFVNHNHMNMKKNMHHVCQHCPWPLGGTDQQTVLGTRAGQEFCLPNKATFTTMDLK